MLRLFSKFTTNPINLVIKRHAGHSKWQNIRHIKGLKDAQKSNAFTKLTRQIKIAIQEGGSSDPKMNNKLDQVLEQAKRINMPAATIQNIMKSTLSDKTQCKSNVFEVKGPGSCIILCEVFTENMHNTKANISTILRKHGCKFTDGGGKHMFEQKGIIDVELSIPPAAAGTDSSTVILELATDYAIECGAEDVRLIPDTENNVKSSDSKVTANNTVLVQFLCDPGIIQAVTHKLELLPDCRVSSSSVESTPVVWQPLSDSDIDTCTAMCGKLMALPEMVKLTDNVA